MVNYERRIHRNMLIIWGVISAVLSVSYFGEVLKGLRSLNYYACFVVVTLLPLIVCIWLHNTERYRSHLSAIMVCGYFCMYVFVLMTGSTTMVFSYILPLLSFMVLSHQSSLVLWTGAAALAANFISVAERFISGEITLENSKDVEIQLALVVLCFIGTWVSARMYDQITKDNEEYLKKMLMQSEQISSQQGQLIEMQTDMEQMAVAAFTDTLTNIGNRLAYDRYLADIPKSCSVGVIFCDVNGLKYCNDTEGHQAGDRLLLRFTTVLTRHFRKQDCFRISGDEFLCILTDVDEAAFMQRAQAFHRRVWSEMPPTASLGWAYGEVLAAEKAAEQHMYSDKQEFYQVFPEYRR